MSSLRDNENSGDNTDRTALYELQSNFIFKEAPSFPFHRDINGGRLFKKHQAKVISLSRDRRVKGELISFHLGPPGFQWKLTLK